MFESLRNQMRRRQLASWAVAAVLAVAISAGCSGGDEKKYDISPIFPLTADKCAQYNGEESGEGVGSTCMVSKKDCERAVEDWRKAMSRVDDAMQFTCD